MFSVVQHRCSPPVVRLETSVGAVFVCVVSASQFRGLPCHQPPTLPLRQTPPRLLHLVRPSLHHHHPHRPTSALTTVHRDQHTRWRSPRPRSLCRPQDLQATSLLRSLRDHPLARQPPRVRIQVRAHQWRSARSARNVSARKRRNASARNTRRGSEENESARIASRRSASPKRRIPTAVMETLSRKPASPQRAHATLFSRMIRTRRFDLEHGQPTSDTVGTSLLHLRAAISSASPHQRINGARRPPPHP
mmetsp:Transcript_25751/g.64667  ORF Transcript_25751/g.64667 Transcript_25751/m.64667 type:complete len:249 (-) Transcript_25751:1017-1763(-)